MNRGRIILLLGLAVLVGGMLAGCRGPAKDTAKWHLHEGNELVIQGSYDEAIEECTKATHLAPNLAEAYVNRAAVYCAKMQYDLAIADCNKAIEIDSGLRGIAYLYRGYVHTRKGQHDLAIADRDKAIEIDPSLVYSAMSLIYYI